MKGKNIFLRAVEMTDVDTLYLFENDISIWNLSDTLMPFSKFAMEQYVLEAASQDIYSLKQLRLMICENESQKVVGMIDLYDFNPKHERAGIGILIASAFRKKGYASEALQLLINYSFTVLQLSQLYCSIAVDNSPSVKLFKNNGFVQTGIKKRWLKHENDYTDELFCQLLNQK